MDIALATVTVISLTMAFAMGIVTCRLIREERRRADARVPMLMADLAADGDNARTVAPAATSAGTRSSEGESRMSSVLGLNVTQRNGFRRAHG